MALHFMLSFYFLFCCYCYFLLLLSVTAKGENNHVEECKELDPSCGYLGEISFPFTTSNNKTCGFTIAGCKHKNAVKEIHLGNQTYKIYSINHMKNSVFIYGQEKPPDIYLESPEIPVHINNLTFYGCSHDSSLENMSKYSACPRYDIYFTPPKPHESPNHMFPIFPFQCLPDHVPNGCTHLISVLEIHIDLQDCEVCYYTESSCQMNENQTNFSCVPHGNRKSPLYAEHSNGKEQHLRAAVIGLSIGLGSMIIIALFVIIFLSTRRIKSSSVQNKSRTNNFQGFSRNITNPESGAVYFGIPVFSYEELQEATNNFDQARELGEGGFGTIYYGKLGDGREVAVKRLFERNYKPVESFTNEIQILTRMRHRNLVSLYGCTSRHSRELLLVYEYIPNGTVSCHLHGDKAKQSTLPWHVRMKIAIETASALAYLHASDVIHRDVKSSNILLDNNFCVKVADFGLSRLFPGNVTHVSTAPRGTPGYVDPDYRICYQLTSKSDVYSFGVVLIELITSLPAVDFTRDRDEIKLANFAIRKIQRREFCELIDPSLGFQSDESLRKEIISVAELAFQCLQGDKELRPSMSEVLEVLQRIASGKNEQGDLEGIDVHDVRVAPTQTCAIPSVPNTW